MLRWMLIMIDSLGGPLGYGCVGGCRLGWVEPRILFDIETSGKI